MNKTKLTLLNKHISSSNDGVILISMSIGIFLIISIFTFFLMKLVVKEHNMSMLHTLDVKTRNLSHSALGRGIFQFSDYSCLLYTSPSPRDRTRSRMPSSA